MYLTIVKLLQSSSDEFQSSSSAGDLAGNGVEFVVIIAHV